MKRPYTRPKIRTYPLKRTEGGCLEWTMSKYPSGYGRLRYGGRCRSAHRVIMGSPPGRYICHHCDNPPCVNPEHLYIGTAATNVRDAVNRGRIRSGHGVNRSPERKREYDKAYWHRNRDNINARRRARRAERKKQQG